MPQVLYAGGKLNSVQVFGNVVDNTGIFPNDGYSNSSLLVNSGFNWAKAFFTNTSGAAASVTTGQTLWFHFIINNPSGTATQQFGYILDGSGYPWFALLYPASGSTGMRFAYNSGTGASPVWTVIATAGVFSAWFTVDIKLTLGSPHTYEISTDQTLLASGTFTQASFTNATHVQFISGSVGVVSVAQILVTEGISTIGAKVKYTTASGAGAFSQFTGNYTDINETVCNDTTAISSTTAGQISTFDWGDVTLPSGYAIKDVFIWQRGKNDGTGPLNLKTVVRSGGSNYVSANMSGISNSYGALLYRSDVNPVTSAAWSSSTWNTIEIGAQSAT